MKRAFTLIELLVVVLIIGILAAVALPQYQKAVEKSRATQALVMLKSLGQAAEEYYLANGKYPTSFDDLSVSVPGDYTGNTKWYNGGIKDTRSNGTWSIQLEEEDNGWPSIHMGRIEGAYRGAGFAYRFGPKSNNLSGIYCAEIASGGMVFEKNEGDYCVKIMGGSLKRSTTHRIYQLP